MVDLENRATLTPRQEQVYKYIVEQNRKGVYPSIMEIGEQLGIRSFNGVSDHLKALEDKQYISRVPGQARSVRAIGVIQQQKLDLAEGDIETFGPVRVECVRVDNGQVQLVISRTL